MKALKNKVLITGGLYSLVRMLIGGYIFVHFAHLIGYATEIFSKEGVLSLESSPFNQLIPNFLGFLDNPIALTVLLLIGCISGIFIFIGKFDGLASFISILILSYLYMRNPLIANPTLPVVGWMLLSHMFISKTNFGSSSAKGNSFLHSEWFYPRNIHLAATYMLGLAYTYSGYTKILSPSWVDGSAISLVLQNPIARDHLLNDVLLYISPIFLIALTWSVLVIELLYLPAYLFKKLRPWFWLAMLLIQFGFLFFLDFADLTFPMLLIHLLTFDRRWINSKNLKKDVTLFYDGKCVFCNKIVMFCLSENVERNIKFAPIEGEVFELEKLEKIKDDSIVFLVKDGEEKEKYYKSDAVINLLYSLGGFWRALGLVFKIFPKIIRDKVYDLVGFVRYKIAGRSDSNICPVLPKKYNNQLLK